MAGSATLAALVVAALLVRPLREGLVGYDAAASVIYFQRIAEGHHLEAFLGATPKALLTITYGVAYSLTHDWRAVSWLVIAAYSLGIGAASLLALRMAGTVAAAFVAIGLIGCAELLRDVDLAYAVSWALLSWMVAGLLVSNATPRYAWAGIALAVGGLARFETLIIVGTIALLLIVEGALARAGRRSSSIRVRLPLLIGGLALPLQALHDWLLTGDPLYAERVPVLGSVGVHVMSVGDTVAFIVGHYAEEPIVILLAGIGLTALLRSRRFEILWGLVILGPGIAAFLVFLAARGIYVSDRYITPADVAVIFAAGIGLAALRAPVVEFGRTVFVSEAGTLHARYRPIFLAMVGVIVAGAGIRPFGPLDASTRRAIAVNAAVHRDLTASTPAIRTAIDGMPNVRDLPGDGSPTAALGTHAVLLVPVLTVPQLAVDLQLPLTALVGTVGNKLATDGSYPRVGQVVFHDVDRDFPGAPFALFEVDRPTTLEAITLVPLAISANHRWWLIRIDP